MIYRIEWVAWGSDLMTPMLKDGWEPFAVTVVLNEFRIWLRKAKSE